MQRPAHTVRQRPSSAVLGLMAFLAACALFAIHVSLGGGSWISPSKADLRVHANPAREAWLATWMPSSIATEISASPGSEAADGRSAAQPAAGAETEELAPIGRPLQQLGVGPALWASHLVILLTDPSPTELYRSMRWLGAILGALFAFLLLRASGLARAPSLVAAGLTAAPVLIHGSSLSPTIVWTLASALAALWATCRITAHGSGWSTIALALALHTGAVVAPLSNGLETLLLVAAFGIFFALGVADRSERVGRLGYVLLAALLATLTSLPIQVEQLKADNLAPVPAADLASTAERARLPRLFPLPVTKETSPGQRTVDLFADIESDREAEGPITLRWDRTDARRFDLPRLRGKHLFVLKKLYHPRWRASFRGRHMDTVCVNGTFQGVIVVPTFRFAEMSFNSLSPLVLLSQWFFAGALLTWLVSALLRRRRSAKRS